MARCKFLCLFAQEHANFRLQELDSLASLAQCKLEYDPAMYSNKNPFLVVQLESEDCVRKIMSRAVLIKSMFELWGAGRDYEQLEESVKLNPPQLLEPFTRDDYTFKMIARSFSRKCSLSRQRQLYERLSFLPLNGKVDLTNPEHELHLLEDYGDNPNTAPSEPLRVYLGRLIATGQRHLIQQYSVKTRHFIGNTSMDALLSLLMANQAKVQSGSLVYDPFAGTGSLLVACAHFRGYVVGADIDATLLHGRGRTSRAGAAQKWRSKDENVCANLRQYGLEKQYIDMLVADAAKCVWRRQEMFDAIVTDPPYGVREGPRKIGSRKEEVKPVPPECEEAHIPAVCKYHLSDVFSDLLEFAANFLVLGGRLVYWLPVIKHEFTEAIIPAHPCLRLVSHSQQSLQTHVARILVTMEKNSSHQRDVHEEQSSATCTVHDSFRDKYFQERHRNSATAPTDALM